MRVTSRSHRLRRLCSAAGCLYLLAAVGLGLIASPRAPWHDHIVIGAHGFKEWAQAVAVHRHTEEGWRTPAEAGTTPIPVSGITPQDRPRVLSIARNLDGAGAPVVDLNSQAASGRGPIERLAVPQAGERFSPPAAHALRPLIVLVPDPPPRVSS